MNIFFVIVIMLVAVAIHYARIGSHKTTIEEKVASLGGTLISYERRNFFSGTGPFMTVGRGRMVYRIEYTVCGRTKEGWVRFGGLMGANWKM